MYQSLVQQEPVINGAGLWIDRNRSRSIMFYDYLCRGYAKQRFLLQARIVINCVLLNNISCILVSSFKSDLRELVHSESRTLRYLLYTFFQVYMYFYSTVSEITVSYMFLLPNVDVGSLLVLIKNTE